MNIIMDSISSKFDNEKIVNCNEDNTIVYRINLKSEGDAHEWIQEYSKISNTNWIVRNGIYNPQRLIYHKHFICQHASKNKKMQDVSKRNTGCCASINIKVKKNNKGTRKNDPFLKRHVPLAGIIKLTVNHNHSTNACGSLKLLRMDDETKKQFISYFDDGLGISESIKQHENKVLLNSLNSLPETAANSRINPTYNMVKNIYNNWRLQHYGHATDNVEKIMEKISYYAEQGTTIDIVRNCPWAVIIITPIMKRTQELSTAREIIFLDSTSSVDSTHSTLTIMLTASKAGALPICIFIHEGQTEESYSNTFHLLKKHNKFAFGGNENSVAFMTDNSAAEKNALKIVWPKTRQLLCHFHVAQAEWRWLLSTKNKIPAEDRQHYMKKFQKVMYSSTEVEFEEVANNILHSTLNENYKKRFLEFLNIKYEWVLYFRKNIITRGHNTNNYSEATMRIIKDIVLQRTKAFNAVALVDYSCTVWEQYCKVRLLNFANGRKDNSFSKLNLLEKVTKNFQISSVNKLDNSTFIVPSLNNTATKYEVNSDIGTCTCPFGIQGAFCKHQYLINKHFKNILPNSPALSAFEKHALAKLALGDELCPDMSFYSGLKYQNSDSEEVITTSQNDNNSNNNFNIIIGNALDNESNLADNSDEEEKFLNTSLLKENFDRISGLLPNTSLANKYLKFINMKLNKINSEQQALDALINVSAVFRKKKGGTIKVQPTSISRRREGVSRGCKRINSGRPALIKSRRYKRKHSLAENIHENRNNAILHGMTH